MVDFRADIHCHSTCSDGTDGPLDLVRLAKAKSLQGLSITDHDCIAAYKPELFSLAAELGVRLLTGVEISTEFEGIPVHILGYGYDLRSASFDAFLSDIRNRRVERNRAILKKLIERKMPIGEEELLALPTQTHGRPHIAQLMVQKNYARSIQDAFQRFLKEGASCYVPGYKYTPQDAICAIREANGKAVLAHPHFYRKGSFMRKLLSQPFDGIECYYAALPKAQELPWLNIAKERGWIATGGSDYHGSIKPTALGASWVGEAVFNALLQK